MTFGGNVLMGSDGMGERFDDAKGFSVSISVDTPEEAERLLSALSEGGKVSMPLQETFWALRFAAFSDRFGTPWLIDCEKKS